MNKKIFFSLGLAFAAIATFAATSGSVFYIGMPNTPKELLKK